jgi:hypothetical protein
MDPQGFNENSGLRASDADRDTAAAVINNALAEGRLTAEEHSERLDSIYSAKTHAELAPLLSDLPGNAAVLPEPSAPAPRGIGSRIIAIFGGATRKGSWHPDPVLNVVAVFGGVELDFRDAVLPGKEVLLRATAVLGGVEVTVPPEMRVVDNGIAILGGREVAGNVAESASPDAPVLRIEGVCVLGGIEVKRKARKVKGARGRNGLTIRVPGGFASGGILDQVRDQRRQIHDQIREQRREIHHQVRDQRRQMRRGWGDDDD